MIWFEADASHLRFIQESCSFSLILYLISLYSSFAYELPTPSSRVQSEPQQQYHVTCSAVQLLSPTLFTDALLLLLLMCILLLLILRHTLLRLSATHSLTSRCTLPSYRRCKHLPPLRTQCSTLHLLLNPICRRLAPLALLHCPLAAPPPALT
jgi:hypothetical protein